MNFRWRKHALLPLMCLVLLGIVSCSGSSQKGFVVPIPGVLTFLDLKNSLYITQSDFPQVGAVGPDQDLFGTTLVAAGDQNFDGFEDVVVGAPGKALVGAVFGLAGSEAGATPSGLSVTQADAGEVSEDGDQFGASLGSGDFNGDKVEDLVVGAPGKAPGGGPQSGAVFVFLGKPDGTFEAGVMLTQADAGEVDEAGDQFGAVIGSGDFDGDGIEELVVGAPGKALGGGPRSGAVFIFPGSAGGFLPGTLLTQTDAGEVNEEGDRFGAAMTVGDFNVDRVDELVVGAPGKESGSGAVFVFLGSITGFTPGFSIRQTDARGVAGCVPSAPGNPGNCVAGANEAGDRFGEALGVGDLSGDGVEELVVGAPGEDGSSGAVFIFPGSPTVARALGEGYFITQANAREANEVGDQFGAALSAGTLNDDDWEELTVGAPGEDGGSGAVFLFPGARGAEAGTVTGFLINQAAAGASKQAGDRFGAAVTVEDFNDNLGAELIVGAPGDDGGSGAVFVFPGVPRSPPAITGENACRQEPGVIRPSGPPGGPLAQPCRADNEAGDRFGSASATADFNGDGFEDLAVGTPGKDGSSGAVFVFPGSLTLNGITTGFFITQTDAGEVNEAGDQFGAAVATGDFDSDGFMDLAVGAPGKGLDSGAVFIFPGSPKGLTCTATLACPTRQLITGSVVTQADAGGLDEAGDRFGATLAVADFDGDGIQDLAVGAPSDGLGGVKAGSVFVFPGSRRAHDRIPGAGIAMGFPITQTDAGEVNEDGDQFGAALTAGDIVGQRFADLIVGAPGEASGADPKAGKVFIFPGSAGGPTAGLFITQTDAGELSEAGDEFGAALAVADFNGDRLRDLAVGAPGDAPAALAPTKAGSVFVFPGSAAGITAGPIAVITHEDLIDPDLLVDITPLADGDRFGAALAVGRFNDSSVSLALFDDLLVGAPGKAPVVATDPEAGTVTIFPGSDGSAVADGEILAEGITLGLFFTQRNNGGLKEAGDQFGVVLAVGDFNGDTLDDLAVSAPTDGLGAEPPESGVVSIIPAADISFLLR